MAHGHFCISTHTYTATCISHTYTATCISCTKQTQKYLSVDVHVHAYSSGRTLPPLLPSFDIPLHLFPLYQPSIFNNSTVCNCYLVPWALVPGPLALPAHWVAEGWCGPSRVGGAALCWQRSRLPWVGPTSANLFN